MYVSLAFTNSKSADSENFSLRWLCGTAIFNKSSVPVQCFLCSFSLFEIWELVKKFTGFSLASLSVESLDIGEGKVVQHRF